MITPCVKDRPRSIGSDDQGRVAKEKNLCPTRQYQNNRTTARDSGVLMYEYLACHYLPNLASARFIWHCILSLRLSQYSSGTFFCVTLSKSFTDTASSKPSSIRQDHVGYFTSRRDQNRAHPGSHDRNWCLDMQTLFAFLERHLSA